MPRREPMNDLSNLYAECPECAEETLHRVHKGRFSSGKKLVIDAVVECSLCSHVHHVTIDEGREVEIPIIVSRQGVSRRSLIMQGLALHNPSFSNLSCLRLRVHTVPLGQSKRTTESASHQHQPEESHQGCRRSLSGSGERFGCLQFMGSLRVGKI